MIEKNLEDLKGLIRVSLGEDPPHMVIRDTSMLDVFTGSILHGNILTYKQWIAYVGEREPMIGKETRIVETGNKVAVPGYVDAHGHADLFYNPSTFADVAITKGATTVFSDAQDMVDSIGPEGFREVLRVSSGFALKYLWSVPAAYPPYPEFEGGELLSMTDIRQLFSDYPECVTMSELSAYMRVIQGEESILEKILLAKSMGKNIEGHLLGASYDRLNALAAAGINSCHESITGSDLRNRVRLGLYTMIRHSSIRSDMGELCREAAGLPKDTLMLVSDGIFPDDLCGRGYLDSVIEEAIASGISPVDAIKMTTLNPARYLKVDGDVGSIAPGRIADVLLLDDIESPTPVTVIEKGRVVAEEGRLLHPSAPFPDLLNRYNPFAFDGVAPSEMEIRSQGDGPVPVIRLEDKTVTRRVDLDLPHQGGLLGVDREQDVRKVLYTRRERKSWGRGFVQGIGARIGGIATTVAHETHGLLILGFDDEDMVLAGNKVLQMGGGIAMVDGGRLLHAFPLQQGGIMSNLPVEELARELARIKGIMRERGSLLEDPFLTITYLTLTSIIELRLTVSGVYDVKRGRIIF